MVECWHMEPLHLLVQGFVDSLYGLEYWSIYLTSVKLKIYEIIVAIVDGHQKYFTSCKSAFLTKLLTTDV